MAAASAVLSLPELLTEILSHLPPFDILRCQRVNRTWQTLITSAPLLQYKSWQRNDYVDPIRADDLIEEIPWQHEYYQDHPAEREEQERLRYIYNVDKHLHPIIVSRTLKNMPETRSYSFEPDEYKDEDGFGGTFSFLPVLLQDLLEWYKENKHTEEKWGNQSLIRPDARIISWSIPSSDDGSMPFRLVAMRTDDPETSKYDSHRLVAKKEPWEPLVLTVGDLIGFLDELWDRWKESERQVHYLSHDGQGCDYDQGLPDCCLDSDEEDMEIDSEDEEAGAVWDNTKKGYKMTADEHVQDCVKRASEFHY
jgi:hypothetical protein